MAANAEVAILAESTVSWQNSKGDALVTMGFVRSVAVTTNYQYEDVRKTNTEYDHTKELQDPDGTVTFTVDYRDRSNAFLGSSLTSSFEAIASGDSVADGSLTIDTVQRDGTYDRSVVSGATITSVSRNADGTISYTFAFVGEPTLSNQASTVAVSVSTSNNPEKMVKAETYIRWKSDGVGYNAGNVAAQATTLGFLEGGWSCSITWNKKAIRTNAGALSHWKEISKPTWQLSVDKLYQDYTTELLMPDAPTGATAAAVSGFFQLTRSGSTTRTRSVPTGTIAIEGKHADGTTIDAWQFVKAKLASWGRNLQADGDRLNLSFTGVGLPTFATATLS